MDLPIEPFLNDIIQKGNENKVLLVSSPTGSGKSIGIPVALASQGYRIFVSVPTVTSAITLATKVQDTFDDISDSVGYAAEGNINYDDEDLLIYVTSGHLRKLILRQFDKGLSKKWQFASFIMIDEFHTGSIDNFIIYNLWKYAIILEKKQAQKLMLPNILLTSATIDMPLGPEIAQYKIPTKSYNVTVSYSRTNYSFNSNRIYIEAANLINKYHNSDLEGHILVFAPGKGEVGKIISNIYGADDAIILPAYGGILPGEMKKIYAKTNKRKIIVATNVAETSITIQNIGLVIDTMCEKIVEMTKNGGTRLALTNISKASADQRKGRTGRTGPGMCIRMITKSSYEKLQEHRIEEILRMPLHYILMEMINVGISPFTILNKIPNTTKVPTEQIFQSNKLLQFLENVNSEYKVTEIGKFVTQFPMSVRNATSLWYWLNSDDYNDNYIGMVVLAIIDSYYPPYIWIPSYDSKTHSSYGDYLIKVEEHIQSYFTRFIGISDIESYLNIWNELFTQTQNEMFYIDSPTLKRHVTRYSKENSLNNKKMLELIKAVKQIKGKCIHLGYRIEENNKIDVKKTMRKLRTIFKTTYRDMILDINDRSYKLKYNNKTTKQTYDMDRSMYLNKLKDIRPKKVISITRKEIKKNKGELRFLALTLDIPDDEIDENGNLKEDPIIINPKSKYLVIDPTRIRGKTSVKYPSTSVVETVKLLEPIDIGEVLNTRLSLKDPNDSKFIIMNTIVVQ